MTNNSMFLACGVGLPTMMDGLSAGILTASTYITYNQTSPSGVVGCAKLPAAYPNISMSFTIPTPSSRPTKHILEVRYSTSGLYSYNYFMIRLWNNNLIRYAQCKIYNGNLYTRSDVFVGQVNAPNTMGVVRMEYDEISDIADIFYNGSFLGNVPISQASQTNAGVVTQTASSSGSGTAYIDYIKGIV